MVIYPRLGDRLNLKIPDKILRFLLQDGFWVVHLPFVCKVKFKFSVDHIAHPVVSSFILFLRFIIIIFLSSTEHLISYYDYYHIYPTPPLGQDMTQDQFLSGV